MQSDLPAKLASRSITPSVAIQHETFARPTSLGTARTMRVGLASDFHAGPTTPLETIAPARAARREAAPILILFGGGFVSLRGARPPQRRPAVRRNPAIGSEE
jgi:hypothetical protein